MRKILTGAFVLLIASQGTAYAYFPAYFQAVFQTFPQCTDTAVTGRIIERFNWADRHSWLAGVTMSAIDREQERAVESFGPSPIDRRYCKGRALLSSGSWHTLYYRIERGMGLAGTHYKVEFCVPGHDPWRVYDGGCRVLRR